MSTNQGIIIADFTTSLATAMAVSGETATLQSATDDDSVALPTGTYYFTIDGTNSSKEHIKCTLTSTSLTAIKSISRQGVESTGVARAHRLGATVTLTNFKYIETINNLLDGTTDLNASVPLAYDADPTLSLDAELATKKYIDDVAIAGAAKATDSVYGISKLSVAAVSGTIPIVVGDNDTRVIPVDSSTVTANMVAALGGTGTPNGTTGLYVTNDDVKDDGTASKVVRLDASSQATIAATPTADTHAASKGYADGLAGYLYTIDAITPADDTTENDIFSTTIAANTLGTTGGIFVKIPFTTTVATTTAMTCTIRLKLGGSTVATSVIEFPDIGGGSGFDAVGYIEAYILPDGATNDQDVFIGGTLASESSGGNDSAPYIDSIGTATSAVDLTSSAVLAVSQQKSTASDSNDCVYGLGHVTFMK